MKVVFAIMSLIIGVPAAQAEHLIIRNPVALDKSFPGGHARFYAPTDVTLCIPQKPGVPPFSAYIDAKTVEIIGTREAVSKFQNCLIRMGADSPSDNEEMSAR
jgi:hypothetical protein